MSEACRQQLVAVQSPIWPSNLIYGVWARGYGPVSRSLLLLCFAFDFVCCIWLSAVLHHSAAITAPIKTPKTPIDANLSKLSDPEAVNRFKSTVKRWRWILMGGGCNGYRRAFRWIWSTVYATKTSTIAAEMAQYCKRMIRVTFSSLCDGRSCIGFRVASRTRWRCCSVKNQKISEIISLFCVALLFRALWFSQ